LFYSKLRLATLGASEAHSGYPSNLPEGQNSILLREDSFKEIGWKEFRPYTSLPGVFISILIAKIDLHTGVEILGQLRIV